MKVNTIVSRYIFREMIPPFMISLVFLTFIFLMTRILEITDKVVNYRMSLWKIGLMMIYTMPYFLGFVIPMSIMMAVLLTFLRMSGDNEITALKAGGASIYRLLPPVFVLCLIGWLLTSLTAIYGLPWGRLSLKDLTYRVMSENVGIVLKERTFIDRFPNVMLYVNRIDHKNRSLVNVFIEDQRKADVVSTIVAPKGKLMSDPENLFFHLRLFNGTIHQINQENRTAHTIHFDRYDINLDMKQIIGSARAGPKDEEEMTLAELRHVIENTKEKDDQYYLTHMEYHEKFSIPFSCFVLGLLGVPLGIQSKSARKSYGIGLGMVFFLFNYMLLTIGWVFGEAGLYPPAIGMWVPNVVTGSIALFMLVRTAKEKPVGIDLVLYYLKKLFSLLKPKERSAPA